MSKATNASSSAFQVYRANGVTSFANTKIQHEPPVHLETSRRRDARKLFYQPGLADTRLAAHDDSASAAALSAGFDDAGKLRQLPLAADEWHACRLSIGDALRLDLPDGDRPVDALDVDLPKALTIEVVCYRTTQSIRYQRLASLGH